MNSNSSRRGFLATLGAMAAAIGAPRKLFAAKPTATQTASVVTGFGQSGNPYQELGVTTVINGEGTMTTLGGSLIRPEVEAVMAQAARHFVSIPELEAAAGRRIAQMLKLPQGYSALVTSGAAGAIQSGLAGILTGDNESLIKQLPDLTGMKSEVIIQKAHRNPFDHQLRGTGVKLIEIETREQLRRAVSDRTAMMHFTNFANAVGQIKVDEWAKLAKQFNIPSMNDAAADTPPVSHLWDYANMGYDLITFSGGKALRGPSLRGHAGARSKSRQRRNCGNGKGPGNLPGRRPRRIGARVAATFRKHFRTNHENSRRQYVLFYPRHCHPCSAYADYVGRADFIDAAASVTNIAQRTAINCYRGR